MAASVEAKHDDTTKDTDNSNVNLSSVILRCTKLYPELFNPSTESTR